MLSRRPSPAHVRRVREAGRAADVSEPRGRESNNARGDCDGALADAPGADLRPVGQLRAQVRLRYSAAPARRVRRSRR